MSNPDWRVDGPLRVETADAELSESLGSLEVLSGRLKGAHRADRAA